MSKSIMQERKECFMTRSITGLHKHHIFRGARRKLSEKWGCWVWLRWDWHNGAPYGVHNDPSLELRIKQLCQMEFERLYGHKKFMDVFGKNYLEVDDGDEC